MNDGAMGQGREGWNKVGEGQEEWNGSSDRGGEGGIGYRKGVNSMAAGFEPSSWTQSGSPGPHGTKPAMSLVWVQIRPLLAVEAYLQVWE